MPLYEAATSRDKVPDVAAFLCFVTKRDPNWLIMKLKSLIGSSGVADEDLSEPLPHSYFKKS